MIERERKSYHKDTVVCKRMNGLYVCQWSLNQIISLGSKHAKTCGSVLTVKTIACIHECFNICFFWQAVYRWTMLGRIFKGKTSNHHVNQNLIRDGILYIFRKQMCLCPTIRGIVKGGIWCSNLLETFYYISKCLFVAG